MKYTEFEQEIFDRSILNYQISGINYHYKVLPYNYYDEFWDIYLNTEEELL